MNQSAAIAHRWLSSRYIQTAKRKHFVLFEWSNYITSSAGHLQGIRAHFLNMHANFFSFCALGWKTKTSVTHWCINLKMFHLIKLLPLNKCPLQEQTHKLYAVVNKDYVSASETITLHDFPIWLSTSVYCWNQHYFINNWGFTERYFSGKVQSRKKNCVNNYLNWNKMFNKRKNRALLTVRRSQKH